MKKAMLVTALAALCFIALPATSFGAARAATGTFSYEDTFTVQPGDPASCTFPIDVDLQVHGSFRVLLDAQGLATSVIVHEVWTGTLTANGQTDIEHAARTQIIDPVTGAETDIDSIHDQALPGGVLIHDVGILRFDGDGNLPFEAGPHQGFSGDPEAIARLCASLT